MIYYFTVEYKGQEYSCEREVKGTKSIVRVIGIGEKEVLLVRGKAAHSVRIAERSARIVAQEIIDSASQ